jgi:hypothetical protein
MKVSARPYLMCGIAVVCASIIAIASAVAPPPDVTVPANRPVPTRTASKATVELLAAVQRMAPAVVASAPGAAAATAAPAPQNAASDLIVNAWNAVLPWIDYGVNLTDYVLGFIPYGYLIGDQISIVYYSLVRPVANSFVVNLVAPVVNAPLNINSYINGLAALGSVTVTSLINLGINEFNYFFGWLIPPIPPIPLAAETAAAKLTGASLAAPTSATPAETGPLADKHRAVEGEALGEPDVDVVKKPKEPKTATPSSTDVAAQGEVRSAPTEKTTDSSNVSNRDKNGEKGSTAKGATGGKHENKGEKKDGTGKKTE